MDSIYPFPEDYLFQLGAVGTMVKGGLRVYQKRKDLTTDQLATITALVGKPSRRDRNHLPQTIVPRPNEEETGSERDAVDETTEIPVVEPQTTRTQQNASASLPNPYDVPESAPIRLTPESIDQVLRQASAEVLNQTEEHSQLRETSTQNMPPPRTGAGANGSR